MKLTFLLLLFCAPLLFAQGPDPLPRTEGTLRVVAFGDSITGDRPGIDYRHHYIKWSDVLQAMLEGQLGEGQAEVLNMGFAGDRTFAAGDRPGALNRVDSNILTQQPDIAVILIGGNNMGTRNRDREELLEQTRDDLTKIVRQVKAAGINVLLLQYTEPKAEDMSQVWTHLNEVNPIIAEVAEAEGVPTLELAPHFASAEEHVPLNALLNATDGVHLQPYGELVVARAVASKLNDLGWVGDPSAKKNEK
ncbi:MAG: SGNH/GDSL hydrolase family protein [Opitutales bacterium]|nr:SGNH/GDSL hydrolase family protein [Opitutales bacterium]MCH8539846.1 SGNH/GDSL hydrolase family protein [Opitutales bacterium]